MPQIEQLEMDADRKQLIADVQALVEKYRAIFDWDVPDIDQRAADALILQEFSKALEQIKQHLLG